MPAEEQPYWRKALQIVERDAKSAGAAAMAAKLKAKVLIGDVGEDIHAMVRRI